MKRVEKKGFNSKREMEVLDALNEVKLLNKRQAIVNHEQLLLKSLSKGDDENLTQDGESTNLSDKMHKFRQKQKFKRIASDSSDEKNSTIVGNLRHLNEIQDPMALLLP